MRNEHAAESSRGADRGEDHGGRAFAKRLMPQSHSATSKRCRGTLGFIGATRDMDVTDAIWVAAS
jgi:hypothetical protein